MNNHILFLDEIKIFMIMIHVRSSSRSSHTFKLFYRTILSLVKYKLFVKKRSFPTGIFAGEENSSRRKLRKSLVKLQPIGACRSIVG